MHYIYGAIPPTRPKLRFLLQDASIDRPPYHHVPLLLPRAGDLMPPSLDLTDKLVDMGSSTLDTKFFVRTWTVLSSPPSLMYACWCLRNRASWRLVEVYFPSALKASWNFTALRAPPRDILVS